jgi:mannose-6-phosphate isomerase-like protein (cupin superfamily)
MYDRIGCATMADYTAKRIADMEATHGGGFVKARAELGVTAFGFQVIQLPPDYTDYPEHDHAETGQEEVFLALTGSGWMDIEGERVELDAETLVRVGPTSRRKVHSGPQGLRMLVIGGAPGEIYSLVSSTELSAVS